MTLCSGQVFGMVYDKRLKLSHRVFVTSWDKCPLKLSLKRSSSNDINYTLKQTLRQKQQNYSLDIANPPFFPFVLSKAEMCPSSLAKLALSSVDRFVSKAAIDVTALNQIQSRQNL